MVFGHFGHQVRLWKTVGNHLSNFPSFFKYYFVEHKIFVKRLTQKKNDKSFKKRNDKIALPSQI